ncbi:MAG: peptidoglycan DL-endopeptidase CwlO [Pseudonocardiales bacterium]|nr:peptidoglycan DL-endopeptidase CwlO [Pseudonocardiales bacterium]
MTTAIAAPSGLAEIQAQISAIQATIASISAPRATSASSAAQFSAALEAATPAAAPAASTTSTAGVTGDAVAQDAKKYLGVPYVWGAESMSGIDCSGLVQAAYGDLGVRLPRVAADQAKMGAEVPSLAQAQPGDLLTFGNPAYHIAIYLGNNQLIESPEPGRTVHITDVYQAPTSIRRILPTSPAASVDGAGRSAQQLVAAGLNPSVAAYATQFAAAEAQYHLPAGLLAAVAQQESGGNAQAVSPAGAQGLMQLMPSTAAGAGVNAFDPAQAIGAAAKILSGNLARFGSVPLALAAYNAGAGAVTQYGGIPPYAETQNYVRRIAAMLAAGG